MNWDLLWIIPLGGFVILRMVFVPWGKILNAISTGSSTSGQAIHQKTFIGAVAVVLLVSLIWWFWSTLDGSLWWRIAPLLLIAVICFRWAKSKDKSLPANIGNTALIALAVVLLVSAPGQKIGEGFDTAADAVSEQGFSVFATDNCIDREPIEENGYFTLQKGCDAQSIVTPDGFVPRFHIADKRFKGSFDDWVPSAWDEHRGNTINFTPKKWPTAVTKVSVQMVSAERAAEIDTAVKKAEEINALFKP